MDRVCTDSQGRVLLLNNTAFKLPSSVMEVNWNQLIQNGDFSMGTTNWEPENSSIIVDNGQLIQTVTSTGYVQLFCYYLPQWIFGNTYYVKIRITDTTFANTTMRIGFNTGNPFTTTATKTSAFIQNNFSDLTEYNIQGGFGAYLGNFFVEKPQIGDYIRYSFGELMNLTSMFGAGNEPSTVEQFESWLQENGINPNTYIPYNAGTTRLMTRPSWLS